MSIDKTFVHPVLRAGRQLVQAEFANTQHHFLWLSVDDVAIHIDVGKVVVRTNLLDLAERRLQRAPVPQTNIVEGVRVSGRIEHGIREPRFERKFLHMIQAEGLSRQSDIVPDVWRLADEFVRANHKRRNITRHQNARDHIRERRYSRRQCKIPNSLRLHVGCCDRSAGDQCCNYKPEAGQDGVVINITDARKEIVLGSDHQVSADIDLKCDDKKKKSHCKRYTFESRGEVHARCEGCRNSSDNGDK